MVPLQVAGSGSHQLRPQRQPLVLMSTSLWTQSRLWEPLYQRKSLTVQVGIGHPSGGVIERRRIAVEAAEEDKARRPVKRLEIATISEEGNLECRGVMSVEFVSSMGDRDTPFYTHMSRVSRDVVGKEDHISSDRRQVRFVLSVMSMQMRALTVSTGSSPQHITN